MMSTCRNVARIATLLVRSEALSKTELAGRGRETSVHMRATLVYQDSYTARIETVYTKVLLGWPHKQHRNPLDR
jgi:hypothetical protein